MNEHDLAYEPPMSMWLEGYQAGADQAWCAKELRRAGHPDVEPSSHEAARIMFDLCYGEDEDDAVAPVAINPEGE